MFWPFFSLAEPNAHLLWTTGYLISYAAGHEVFHIDFLPKGLACFLKLIRKPVQLTWQERTFQKTVITGKNSTLGSSQPCCQWKRKWSRASFEAFIEQLPPGHEMFSHSIAFYSVINLSITCIYIPLFNTCMAINKVLLLLYFCEQ